MKYDVGTTAGRIWEQLEKNDELTPRKLATAIKGKSDEIYLALGWLAREGKVSFTPTKSSFKVKLNR